MWVDCSIYWWILSFVGFLKMSPVIGQIVLLLRLVPLLPFNMLNYLLSVTPVPIGEYMLASWLGMMVFASLWTITFKLLVPTFSACCWCVSVLVVLLCLGFKHWKWCFLQPITLALVYVGTTLKDLSDVTHGWSEFSTARWVSHAIFICSLFSVYLFEWSVLMWGFLRYASFVAI